MVGRCTVCYGGVRYVMVVYCMLFWCIDYCITIWGYAPKCHLQRIQRLQNKIFRLITNQFGWDTSPRDILNDLDVHNVTQRREYFNGVNVYRCLMVFILIICQICYTIQVIIIYIQLETLPQVFFMFQNQD